TTLASLGTATHPVYLPNSSGGDWSDLGTWGSLTSLRLRGRFEGCALFMFLSSPNASRFRFRALGFWALAELVELVVGGRRNFATADPGRGDSSSSSLVVSHNSIVGIRETTSWYATSGRLG